MSPHAATHALFQKIKDATTDAPGVTRVAYGDGEQIAHDMVAAFATEYGAEKTFDAAGNQFLTLPGKDRSRRIVLGSHLDSVPHGGDYDGTAGVLLGLAVATSLADNGIVPPFDLTVACLRAEESCWFPHSYIGSKTALGRLEPGALDTVRRVDSGRTLGEHIAEAGFDPDAVAAGDTFLKPADVVAYIEAHIEQAPLLETEDIPVGIVTGIRGSSRFREIKCVGVYAHSGAMPRKLRHDAALASAHLVVAMDEVWDEFEAKGEDLTVTFGMVNTDPTQHSFSKVAGEVGLCLDMRSESRPTLEAATQRFRERAAVIAQRFGVTFEEGPKSGSEPAVMSPVLNEMAEGAAARLGIKTRRMPSGAGHDAATFAHAGIPSTMIFIRNQNGSHNPDEAMKLPDFDAAVNIVIDMMMRPATEWSAAGKT
ncbi:hydantoinase/carbamoylase family amidase [Acuticoccus mangrovi]|uniref:Hydantoinase/carbamoylase family amidase n=1 Tax=Acuticoccus mangrovi TaxID=2796142 RepID=A0A934ILA8_9HYPH|nr:hydantoinase/carbamoylase family amidase [Acuticoccus mangrovi]MBJ3774456.1 hydantoinase/carbamoylase family amidase [Acuticoccus mangrovi]